MQKSTYGREDSDNTTIEFMILRLCIQKLMQKRTTEREDGDNTTIGLTIMRYLHKSECRKVFM